MGLEGWTLRVGRNLRRGGSKTELVWRVGGKVSDERWEKQHRDGGSLGGEQTG